MHHTRIHWERTKNALCADGNPFTVRSSLKTFPETCVSCLARIAEPFRTTPPHLLGTSPSIRKMSTVSVRPWSTSSSTSSSFKNTANSPACFFCSSQTHWPCFWTLKKKAIIPAVTANWPHLQARTGGRKLCPPTPLGPPSKQPSCSRSPSAGDVTSKQTAQST